MYAQTTASTRNMTPNITALKKLVDVQPGWASTNFFNAVMFGVMFLVLAVVCAYMAEMRSEVKRRPLYIVQGELQSNAMLTDTETRNVVSHEDRIESASGRPRTPVRTE